MLQTITVLLSLAASVSWAVPLHPREVPQEHSHERFLTSVRDSLNLDNPDGIVDSVFGLLGDAAAADGLGQITDASCLQQATADRAFTNAKAAGDVQGQVDALIYRALERNSGQVGAVSPLCTSIEAVNPEIAAIQQHQDPASTGAQELNKNIVLELARQIKAVGGDPLDALKSGTFAPGNLDDPTAKGNSCNVLDDPEGCIFTLNLLVPDATEEEILAAVGDVAANAEASATEASSTATASEIAGTQSCAPAAVTVTVTEAQATATAAASHSRGIRTRTRHGSRSRTAPKSASTTGSAAAAD